MTTLTGLCTLLAVGALLVILFYIAWQGIDSLNIRFLTDTPRPVGEGGGIGNAIVGSLVLLLISSAIGLPLGICVGVYLSEVGRGRFAGAVRFIVDTITGIPSIVTGVFVYAILVVPMKHFSAMAGGVALALIGWIYTGLGIIALGVVAPRLIKRTAPHFVLQQALGDAAVYDEVTRSGLLRVTSVTGDKR